MKNNENLYKNNVINGTPSSVDSYGDGDDYMDDLMSMMSSSDEGTSLEVEALPVVDSGEAVGEVGSSLLQEDVLPVMADVKPVVRGRRPLFSNDDSEDSSTISINNDESLSLDKIIIRDEPVVEPIAIDTPSVETIEVVEEVAPIANVLVHDEPIESEDEMLAQMLNNRPSDFNEKDAHDNFNAMFNELEIEEIDGDELPVSLEKPGMNEVVVTPDGKTLSEILPTLRSGRKTFDDVISGLRDDSKAVDIAGKKRSDLRYVGHIVEENEKNALDKERKKLSNLYIQKHRRFTEQEKIIMRNLGVSNEQFARMVHKDNVDEETRERVLAAGVLGAERYFKGRRFRTTVGDMAILDYLAKFKFANTRVLRWLQDEAQTKSTRKLNRLKENGLVTSMSVVGIPDLWGSTRAGLAVSGYDLPPALAKMPKLGSISGALGVNYLAACLWFNTVNVLNLDDFPASNRIMPKRADGTNRTRGEELVSELEIRSNLGKEINPSSTTMKTRGDKRLYDIIGDNVRREFDAWEKGGFVGDSPEMLMGNEHMWVLYPQGNFTGEYHVPDLVVKRERGENGEPRSIAVELERYAKNNNSYRKIMLAYKLDKNLYEKVIWVTPDNRVERMLRQAAEEVGFENYDVVPIITKDGINNVNDIWMI